jgi:hypothetical protein
MILRDEIRETLERKILLLTDNRGVKLDLRACFARDAAGVLALKHANDRSAAEMFIYLDPKDCEALAGSLLLVAKDYENRLKEPNK